MRRRKSLLEVVILVAIVTMLLAIFIPVVYGPNPKPAVGGAGSGDGTGASGAYTLKFGEGFNAALASRDDLGISVVIAMDVSGSMSDPPQSGDANPKYMQAAAALAEVERVLERLVASAPPEQVIKVGLIKFNEAVEPVLALTPLDRAGMRLLREAAENEDNFAPGGKTAIGRAIELGAEWLAQSGTILRSLVIITDGENTEGLEPGRAIEALYANRNSASKEGYTVSTSSTLLSFIGFDVDSSYFQRFATLGARVTSAADREQLAAALTSILEADITKLEAPNLGTSPDPDTVLIPQPATGGTSAAKPKKVTR